MMRAVVNCFNEGAFRGKLCLQLKIDRTQIFFSQEAACYAGLICNDDKAEIIPGKKAKGAGRIWKQAQTFRTSDVTHFFVQSPTAIKEHSSRHPIDSISNL